MKGAHQKQFRCLFPTYTHRKSGKPPSDRGHKASERWWGLFSTFLNNTQNKEAHKWTEGTPSFWRRHNMFKLWQMSKDSDRPTQTQKETQGALTTHSHTISPNTSLSSKVTARPCWEKGFFAVTIPEQESCSGTVKTAKEVSSANLSSLNTHPSFLGIKRPMPCGSLTPPVLAPNPPRKETPLHLTNLPNDFKSEVIDVVLVIFKRRRALTSCPLIATAAPNSGFLGSHTSTCLSALEKSHRPTEGHSPQPSCGDRSRHMLSLFRLGCRARVQPTHWGPKVLPKGRRRARHAAHTSSEHFNAWELCVDAHYPTGPNEAKHLPTAVCPTSLAPCLSLLGRRSLKTTTPPSPSFSESISIPKRCKGATTWCQWFGKFFLVVSLDWFFAQAMCKISLSLEW